MVLSVRSDWEAKALDMGFPGWGAAQGGAAAAGFAREFYLNVMHYE